MRNVTLNFELMKYKFDKHFGDTNALGKWLDKLNHISNLRKTDNNQLYLDKVALIALSELADEEQVYLINDEKNEFIRLMNQLPSKTVCAIAA